MESIFIYLIKSSTFLLIAYIIYILLVRFTTFHFLNRSYLLLSVGISLIIPFIQFPVEESHLVYAYTLPTIEIMEASKTSIDEPAFDFRQALIWFYALVCSGLIIKLIYYIFSLASILYKHPKQRIDKFSLIRSDAINQAFSFFRYIVVPNHLNNTAEHIIVRHEMLHAHKWHSLDILLLEWVKVFFWFHPVVYLLKQELIKQHEYEIDRLLTTHTFDVEQYGNLLIQQAQLIPVQLSLTNNFNHSLIKNRIQMMSKPKSSNIQLLRYAILLPVIFLIGTLMAFEKEANEPAALEILMVDKEENNNTSFFNQYETELPTKVKQTVLKKPKAKAVSKPNKSTKKNVLSAKQVNLLKIDSNKTKKDPTYTIVEEMPEFPGGDLALFDHFGSNIQYPEEARLANIQGTVVLGFTVKKDGSISDLKVVRDIGGGCGEEAMRIAKLMPNWEPGKQDGKAVRVAFKFPVMFSLKNDQENTRNSNISDPITMTEERKEANPEVPYIVEQMPEFPGGTEALFKFFGSNIVYPETAKKEQIEGIVVLDFIVEKDGNVSNLKVVRDIGGGCGDEVLRVAKQMPKWSPGMEDGRAVKVSYKLPVRLKLDGEKPKSDE